MKVFEQLVGCRMLFLCRNPKNLRREAVRHPRIQDLLRFHSDVKLHAQDVARGSGQGVLRAKPEAALVQHVLQKPSLWFLRNALLLFVLLRWRVLLLGACLLRLLVVVLLLVESLLAFLFLKR